MAPASAPQNNDGIYLQHVTGEERRDGERLDHLPCPVETELVLGVCEDHAPGFGDGGCAERLSEGY